MPLARLSVAASLWLHTVLEWVIKELTFNKAGCAKSFCRHTHTHTSHDTINKRQHILVATDLSSAASLSGFEPSLIYLLSGFPSTRGLISLYHSFFMGKIGMIEYLSRGVLIRTR